MFLHEDGEYSGVVQYFHKIVLVYMCACGCVYVLCLHVCVHGACAGCEHICTNMTTLNFKNKVFAESVHVHEVCLCVF